MATFNAGKLYGILQGTPAQVVDTTTILGVGPTGNAALRRRLVHPDSITFPAVVYFQNPDRTINLDNEPLRAPIAQAIRTLSTSATVRFDEVVGDVVVTEIWEAGQGKFAMPGFLFRQLYDLLMNPPTFVPAAPVFIQYEPRDRNPNVYNVELLRLLVGSGDAGALFDVTEFVPQGAGSAQDPLATIDDAFAQFGGGLIDRTVVLSMKIHSKV